MSGLALSAADAAALESCIAAAGVAVIPTDTVYGVACDPRSERALRRVYEMKGRPAAKPAAVMYCSMDAAEPELQELPPRTRDAAATLLPGPVTLLLPNPARRFPLACEPGGAGSVQPAPLGLRVPAWPRRLQALQGVRVPLLQSSANLSGEPPPRRLADVPESIRSASDLLLDGGELPGLASTVIDLTELEQGGSWRVVREGALGSQAISAALAAVARRC